MSFFGDEELTALVLSLAKGQGSLTEQDAIDFAAWAEQVVSNARKVDLVLSGALLAARDPKSTTGWSFRPAERGSTGQDEGRVVFGPILTETPSFPAAGIFVSARTQQAFLNGVKVGTIRLYEGDEVCLNVSVGNTLHTIRPKSLSAIGMVRLWAEGRKRIVEAVESGQK